jgi:signal transduction histidine kinase
MARGKINIYKEQKAASLRTSIPMLPTLRSTQFSSSLYRSRLRYTSMIAAMIVVLIGATVLIGWLTNTISLTSILPQLPSMKTNSALCFIFAGFTVLLYHWRRPNLFIKFIRDFCALSVLVIASITLSQYLFQVNLGIDELLFREPQNQVGTTSPNRMAPNTAAIFIFTALSLLTLERKIRGRFVTQELMLVGATILFPTFIGYLFNVEFIYGLASNTKMALPTGIAFMILIVSILLARPTHGFLGITTVDSAGGFLARRLLILSIFMPLIIGWFILAGYRANFYDAEFRFLFIITVNIILFTYLIWRNARALDRLDLQRRLTEKRILFLAEASKILSSSLKPKATLTRLANLAVPEIADWCVIDVLDDKGRAQQVAIAHINPKKLPLANRIRKYFPADSNQSFGLAHVLRTGKVEFNEVLNNQIFEKTIQDKKILSDIKKFGFSSSIIVPISLQQKVLGAIQMVQAESGRHFTKADLLLAEELASRVALALDNARLFKTSQDAIKLRDEFLSIASHELKTPITSLKVYTQVLGKQLRKEEKPALYLQKMDVQITKLTQLISDLLDVSRIQFGKLAFQIEAFDINELVADIAETLQPTLDNHKIQIVGKSSKLVSGDRDRISQVLINLLTNAAKYSPDADKIVVSITNDQQKASVSVKDFGIGIDKKHVSRVFDRFYQIREKNSRAFPGLGMGLYICKAIIERHNGSLTVESEIGQGSTFQFTLPTSKK